MIDYFERWQIIKIMMVVNLASRLDEKLTSSNAQKELQLTSILHNELKDPLIRKLDWWICLVSLSISTVAALVWWWNRMSLWEDEIVAITHAKQSFPLFLSKYSEMTSITNLLSAIKSVGRIGV